MAFDSFPLYFEHFFTFWPRICKFSVYFLCSVLFLDLFYQGVACSRAWYLETRIWVLSVLIVIVMWLLQDLYETELGNMFTYIQTRTYTHHIYVLFLHMCIYVYIYVYTQNMYILAYVSKSMSSYWYLQFQRNITNFILASTSFIISPSNSEKLAPIIFSILTYLLNSCSTCFFFFLNVLIVLASSLVLAVSSALAPSSWNPSPLCRDCVLRPSPLHVKGRTGIRSY